MKIAQMPPKPWVGFDLDGTLAKQYWPHDGEFDPLRIGPPIPAMVAIVHRVIAEGYQAKVFTARVGPRGNSPNNKGVKLADVHRAITDWTKEHLGIALEATSVKDYNMICLYDDRAISVEHNTGRILLPAS